MALTFDMKASETLVEFPITLGDFLALAFGLASHSLVRCLAREVKQRGVQGVRLGVPGRESPSLLLRVSLLLVPLLLCQLLGRFGSLLFTSEFFL